MEKVIEKEGKTLVTVYSGFPELIKC
ncbi:hypothetical protein EZS27_041291, partial [termite gut metagenome]